MMLRPGLFLVRLVLVATLALLAVPVARAWGDLLDVSEGATAVDHSPLLAGEVAEEMLGLVPETGPEQGSLIFSDSFPDGTVHYVEWEMPEPVTVGRVRLFAAGDSCSSTARTFDHFRLLAFIGETSETLIDEPLMVPYQYLHPCSVVLALATPMVAATRFRAEFTQPFAGGFPGPRVIELDGLPAGVCGDANDDGAFTATDALITLRSAVGNAFCEGCICNVNDDANTTAGDALASLSFAVGQPVDLVCPPCPLSTGLAFTAPR